MSGMQRHDLLESLGNNDARSVAKRQAEQLAAAKSWAWNVPGNILFGAEWSNPAIPITYPDTKPAPIPQIVTTFGMIAGGTSFHSIGDLVSRTMNITFTTYEFEDNDMLLEVNKDLPKLHDSYGFDEQKVFAFVRSNPYIMPVLLDAPLSISGRFGDDSSLALEVFTNPEQVGKDHLRLMIQTHLSVDEALDQLTQLYDEWFFEVLPATRDKLLIDVEPL